MYWSVAKCQILLFFFPDYEFLHILDLYYWNLSCTQTTNDFFDRKAGAGTKSCLQYTVNMRVLQVKCSLMKVGEFVPFLVFCVFSVVFSLEKIGLN